MRHAEIDFPAIDFSLLSSEQRERLKRHAIHRAKDDRDLALRAMFTGLAAWLRRTGSAVVQWRAANRKRRACRHAAAELNALDDRALKDIGVSRCEIGALAFGGRG
jgi:uncharacterized protein YjiS (DUF1127 family)